MAKADTVKFQNQLSSNVESGLLHDHSDPMHSHGQEHGHTHEHLEHAGELTCESGERTQ